MRKRRLQNLLSATMFGMFIVGIMLPYTPVLATGTETSVEINEKNFPDANFRAYISNQEIDQNQDASLSKEEIEAVRNIHCNGWGKSDEDKIADLTGIQYFTNLTSLSCNYNKLTELDVSQNTKLTELSCRDNQLTKLDVSQNKELTSLYCFNNKLIKLDSKNPNLTDLRCYNNQLPDLDVSQNKELTSLYCSNNKLIKLDVSQNKELISLDCFYNQLTKLDVSQNKELTSLDCVSNQITDLDVSQNPKLISLGCVSNQITDLDVSQNKELTYLYCSNNKLIKLDVSQNPKLTYLYCSNNKLIKLDVSQNPKLTDLSCNDNQITDLDVSQNKELTSLDCSFNQLTDLDVSQNKELTYLYCSDNQLTDLDVSQNKELVVLDCSFNQITDLDVSQNMKLTYLYCSDNQLTNLDLSNNNKIAYSNLINNTYAIANGALLTELSGFDITRVKNVEGGNFENGKVNYDEGSNTIKYNYQCVKNQESPSLEFTLKKHNGEVIEIPEKKVTCTQDGKKGYYQCECCGRYFEDKELTKKIKDIKTWGIIKATGHTFSTSYLPEHADENKHYHVCINPNCKEKDQGEAHTFVWVTDKVATTTEKGLKHEECSVCKYKKAAVEIPVISVPVVKGEKVVDKKTKSKFRVLKSDEVAKELQYIGPTSKKLKVVKIPDVIVIKGVTYKVTSIAKDAFKNNKYLQKVIIGKNIKKIDKKAFYGCKKLKSVTLGKELTVIEDDAFKNCTSLNKVTIPSKVTKIDQGAFYGCKKLKKMTIKSKKLKTVGKNAIKNINKKAYIDVPKSKVKTYKKLFKSKTGYKKSMKLK